MTSLVCAPPTPVVAESTAVAKEQDFRDFHREIESQLTELEASIRRTRSTKALAGAFRERGSLGTLWGNVIGRNDKELAKMVQDLGMSLETTQVILQLLLKVQMCKTQFLRGFHDALVNKILELQKNTSTLDTNQRDAALAIVGTLKDHIASQIEHHRLVAHHEQKLARLTAALGEQRQRDEAQDAKLGSIEKWASGQGVALQALGKEVDSLQAEQARAAEAHADDIRRISGGLTALDAKGAARSDAIEQLREELAALSQRIGGVENALASASRPAAIIRRNVVGLAALGCAIAALCQ